MTKKFWLAVFALRNVNLDEFHRVEQSLFCQGEANPRRVREPLKFIDLHFLFLCIYLSINRSIRTRLTVVNPYLLIDKNPMENRIYSEKAIEILEVAERHMRAGGYDAVSFRGRSRDQKLKRPLPFSAEDGSGRRRGASLSGQNPERVGRPRRCNINGT